MYLWLKWFLSITSRFVILKLVPRDLLFHLPIPKRIRDYLNTPFYYSEAIADWTEENNSPPPPVIEAREDVSDTQESQLTSQPESVREEPVVQSDSQQEVDSVVASSSL